MDDATRHSLLQVLGREMSDISEESYCAGWLGGSEHFIPELCRRAISSGRTQNWGRMRITPERARGLVYLADLIGCWANVDVQNDGYIPHQPFPCPSEYVEMIDCEQTMANP